MRQTNRYGNRYGARIVELRRGTVSRVETGCVYWLTEDERKLTGALLRFNATGFCYTGEIAKALAAELSAINVASQLAGTDPREAFDAAISRPRATLDQLRQLA